MKKLTLLALFTASLMNMASAENSEKTTEQAQAPELFFSVIDDSSKVGRRLEKNEYSVSNQHLRLCWAVTNLPISASNQVTETFNAPAKAQFTSPNSRTIVSKDKKVHQIISTTATKADNMIDKCWKFGKTDPLGQYQFTLKVNDLVFPTMEFKLVK
ncbi:hypothetical protein A4G19_06575 [Pasteurellaceae bacterium Macca]|nr:hypothetical protein [Pasteurellaceae bacterium Macca]